MALGNEKSQAIINAAIEAGTIKSEEITIVIVYSRDGKLDMGSTGPSPEAVAFMTARTLLLALFELQDTEVKLLDRIEVAKD